ncbi:hypothetical protein AMS62_01680 [Bacillus sp. FJAT-18019]|nr:hypothetical protein AMS62_01680 [Bacillus sp. FJAT-18019]
MSFSVGLFDRLFGKKIELEIPYDGQVVKRTVTKKWYDQMIKEGKFVKVEEEVVTVHMIHPFNGYSILNWVVGVDIPRETVLEFINDNGELYAMTFYENGEENVMVVKKEMFDETYKELSDL